MKLSEVTLDVIRDFCGISDTDNNTLLQACFRAAVAYAVGYTGHTEAELDEYEDIPNAVMILTNDYFLFRYSGMGNDKPNPAVEHILSMHCVNFL